MKKVLIIEDDGDITDILRYVLDEEGYEVKTSFFKISVAEILQINPNVLLIDIRLSNGSGADLCLELKNNSDSKHLPVILFSAHHELAEIAKLKCADAFIAKPFDISELIAIIAQLALP